MTKAQYLKAVKRARRIYAYVQVTDARKVATRISHASAELLVCQVARGDAIDAAWADDDRRTLVIGENNVTDNLDLTKALDLLGRLFFLVENEWQCDYSNGVAYQGADEGDVHASRFLVDIEEFLANHGDEHALELQRYRQSLIEETDTDAPKLPF